jgi:hypothetical protein
MESFLVVSNLMPEQPLNSGSLFTHGIACRVQRDPPPTGQLRDATLLIREAEGNKVLYSSTWGIQILKKGYSIAPAPFPLPPESHYFCIYPRPSADLFLLSSQN